MRNLKKDVAVLPRLNKSLKFVRRMKKKEKLYIYLHLLTGEQSEIFIFRM